MERQMNERWSIDKARAYFASGKCKAQKKKVTGKKAKFQMKMMLKDAGVNFTSEYKFSTKRNFRFDHAIIDEKIGIEYEGLMSEKSGHTTVIGFTKDTDKYNLAQAEGWIVLRYTALNYGNLAKDLKKIINGKILR